MIIASGAFLTMFSLTSSAQTGIRDDSSITLQKDRLFENFQREIVTINESKSMLIIPNYTEPIQGDKLGVITRYIGDSFVTEGVSLTHSGAINSHGNIQMVINTRDLANRGLYKPIRGGGPHMWIAKRFSSNKLNPWSEHEELVLQMHAAVPYVKLKDKDGKAASSGFSADQAPVTQLSFGVYLYDQSTNKTFAYIIPVYESRGTYQESANNNDTWTSFISSPLEDNSLYITKSPNSERLQCEPFSQKKFFEVSITRKNLLKGIKDSNIGLSQDLSNYQLTFLGVLFELPNFVKDGSNVSMVEVSDLFSFIK